MAEQTQPEWRDFGAERDPVIRAASEWLMQQPSCQVTVPKMTRVFELGGCGFRRVPDA
jgi:hypothetical protein